MPVVERCCRDNVPPVRSILSSSPRDMQTRVGRFQARFPFKRNRLRCVRCVKENRKKRKRLRWQVANQPNFHATNASASQ